MVKDNKNVYLEWSRYLTVIEPNASLSLLQAKSFLNDKIENGGKVIVYEGDHDNIVKVITEPF